MNPLDPSPGKPTENSADEHDEFLASWNKSMLGRRPSIGVPFRGLRGASVVAASVAGVVGIVIGGTLAVQAIPGALKDDPDTTLTSADLRTPTAAPSATTPQPSATRHPHKARTTQEAVPARTRTVTETAAERPSVTESPKVTARKTSSQQQTVVEKKKATAAAQAAEKKPGATTASIGTIRNLVTGLCVDLPGVEAAGENEVVQQNTCVGNGTDNQLFQTIKQANGTFLLRENKSHWCLDATGSESVLAGTPVNTHTCLLGGADNQMFRKQYEGAGFFLVNVKSGLCLDVSDEDGKYQPGSKLTLSNCSTSDDHIWSFSS